MKTSIMDGVQTFAGNGQEGQKFPIAQSTPIKSIEKVIIDEQPVATDCYNAEDKGGTYWEVTLDGIVAPEGSQVRIEYKQ